MLRSTIELDTPRSRFISFYLIVRLIIDSVTTRCSLVSIYSLDAARVYVSPLASLRSESTSDCLHHD